MKKNAGFTLVELMTVIAIIGLLAIIAVPNLIEWRANHQLNGSARELQAFINSARLEAIKNNATVTVTIDAANRRVTSQYVNRAVVGLPPVNKEVLLGHGVNIDSGASTIAGNTFNFNSRGLPSNFGRITLQKADGDIRQVIMSNTGDTRIGI